MEIEAGVKVGDKVEVNKEQCEFIANKLKDLKFKPEIFQREYLTFPADKETKLRVFLFSAAICHQTHALINKKRNLKGWDYLEFVFAQLGKENSLLINPNYLAQQSPVELSEQLKPLFADDGNPENCTLDRLEQRAQFMIDISKLLNQKYAGKVENVLEASNGYLFNQGNGLYKLLAEFTAFADPLCKKSTIVIRFIVDAKLLIIKDLENLVPSMDYHKQRLLLRTGCVEVLDKTLQKDLQHKRKLASDEEIRKAAVEAIKMLAKFSGRTQLEIGDFLWPLGRSCCREKILCVSKVCDKNPCTFDLFVELPSHDQCIFEGICKGSNYEEYRKYWQPNVDTDYY